MTEDRAGVESSAPNAAPDIIKQAGQIIQQMRGYSPVDMAWALFDAGLLRTGRHAEVLRQLDRVEAAYNTLREGLEGLCSGVQFVHTVLLRDLLSKDGNDGT